MALRDRFVNRLQLPEEFSSIANFNTDDPMKFLSSARVDFDVNISDASSDVGDPFSAVHDAEYRSEITEQFLTSADDTVINKQPINFNNNLDDDLGMNIREFMSKRCRVFNEDDEALAIIKEAVKNVKNTPKDPVKRLASLKAEEQANPVSCEDLWSSSSSINLKHFPIPPGRRILPKDSRPVSEDEVADIEWRRYDANIQKCQAWMEANIEQMMDGGS